MARFFAAWSPSHLSADPPWAAASAVASPWPEKETLILKVSYRKVLEGGPRAYRCLVRWACGRKGVCRPLLQLRRCCLLTSLQSMPRADLRSHAHAEGTRYRHNSSLIMSRWALSHKPSASPAFPRNLTRLLNSQTRKSQPNRENDLLVCSCQNCQRSCHLASSSSSRISLRLITQLRTEIMLYPTYPTRRSLAQPPPGTTRGSRIRFLQDADGKLCVSTTLTALTAQSTLRTKPRLPFCTTQHKARS